MYIMLITFTICFFIALINSIIIVKPQQAVVIEKFGKFDRILNPGINFINPCVEAPRKIVKVKRIKNSNGQIRLNMEYTKFIDLYETVYDFLNQKVVTKDKQNAMVDLYLYFTITDPKRAVYMIENLPAAIYKLTKTSLDNIAEQFTFDEFITTCDIINNKLKEAIKRSSTKWGINVNHVELTNIALTDIR